MLEIKELRSYYGKIEALKGIEFDVGQGEVVAVIGANGAGKSTLLATITGFQSSASGQIKYLGQDILKKSPHEIVRLGISQVFEGRQILCSLTVQENLDLGAYARKDREGIRADLETIFDKFPILRERKHQLAGTLSGGEQQMLAIARALMSRPKLLLMDEPSLGLAPKVISEIFRIIADLQKSGITILLVEQNAKKALQVANRGYLMANGRIVFHGCREELIKSEIIQKAYLGAQINPNNSVI